LVLISEEGGYRSPHSGKFGSDTAVLPRLFASQGELYIAVKASFGEAEYTDGSVSHDTAMVQPTRPAGLDSMFWPIDVEVPHVPWSFPGEPGYVSSLALAW